MELGLAPDDDSLFEEVTQKLKKPQPQQSYSIKNCRPLVMFDTCTHTLTATVDSLDWPVVMLVFGSLVVISSAYLFGSQNLF